MRKHFLLLFLMAILPLAGWAVTDISQATFTIGLVSYKYTAATPTVATAAADNKMVPTVVPLGATDPLVYGETKDYILVYYDKDGNPINDADVATSVKNVGNYFVAAKGVNDYEGTTEKVAFQILPADLTITITAEIAKQYGNKTKPNVTFAWTGTGTNVTFDGWKGSDETTANKNAVVSSLTFEWGTAEENANANHDGTNWYNSTTKGQKLTWQVAPIPNYIYTINHADGLKVTPVALSTSAGTKFSFAADYVKVTPASGTTPASGGYLYNGEPQVPNYTITYTDPQNVVRTLDEKKGTAITGDYTVSYKWCATTTYADATDAVNNKNAGYYWPTITAVEKGNYSGEVTFPAAFDGETAYYQIRKKDLKINIKDKTKVYDGTAYSNASVEYNPLGLVAADVVADIEDLYADATDPAFSYTPTPIFAADAKTYRATPAVDDTKLTDAIQNNYNVTAGTSGFLTISKRPVTVTALNLDREIDEVDPNLAALDLAGTDFDDYGDYVDIQAEAEGVGLVGTSEGEKKDVLKAVSLDLDYTYAGADTYVGAIKVIIDNTLSKNYIVTGVNGNWKVNGYVLSIYAVNNTKAYGESLDELDYATSGLIGQLGANTNISYIITKTSGAALTDADYVNGRLKVGGYKIVINPESVVELPADYDDYAIDPTAATLTITKKTIYAIAPEVALNTGDTKTDLNTLGKDKVRFLESLDTDPVTGEYTAADGIEENDNIDYELQFSGGVTVVEGKITNANDVDDGVVVYAPAAKTGYENNQYTIDVTTTADLKIGGSILVLDREDAELRTKLTVANNKTYTVRFKNERTLNAKKWYSMILPFEISVAKLSQFLGYAIVNLLDETATDGNVHFYLTMDKIPANKPFLVKAVDDNENVNLNYVATTNERELANIKIIDPAADTKTVTSTGVEFTGVFKKEFVLSTGDKFYTGLASDKFYQVGDKETKLNPFASFWRAATSARVFVEDLDENGATVIKEISAQTMSEIATDGWYTLNGMKLQSVPTEKGVYIHNGKKVVLK